MTAKNWLDQRAEQQTEFWTGHIQYVLLRCHSTLHCPYLLKIYLLNLSGKIQLNLAGVLVKINFKSKGRKEYIKKAAADK